MTRATFKRLLERLRASHLRLVQEPVCSAARLNGLAGSASDFAQGLPDESKRVPELGSTAEEGNPQLTDYELPRLEEKREKRDTMRDRAAQRNRQWKERSPPD